MVKREARKIIHERLRSKYTATDCRVFEKIVSLIRVSDYRKTDITGRRCSSKKKSLAKLLFKTEGHVERSVTKFEKDGLLIVFKGEGAKGQDEYGINVDELSKLALPVGAGGLPQYKDIKKQKRSERYQQKKATSVPMVSVPCRLTPELTLMLLGKRTRSVPDTPKTTESGLHV